MIGMLVAGPGRNGEDIALFPVKALSLDDTKAASVNHQVDTATGVLMGLRVAAGAQELGSTAHGGQHRPAGVGIRIDEEHIVIRGGGRVGQPLRRRCAPTYS